MIGRAEAQSGLARPHVTLYSRRVSIRLKGPPEVYTTLPRLSRDYVSIHVNPKQAHPLFFEIDCNIQRMIFFTACWSPRSFLSNRPPSLQTHYPTLPLETPQGTHRTTLARLRLREHLRQFITTTPKCLRLLYIYQPKTNVIFNHGSSSSPSKSSSSSRQSAPHGSPPPFDLKRGTWNVTIWTNQLKSSLSTTTLQVVFLAGLTAARLGDHEEIINLLRTPFNAGRNRHVWLHQFATCFQLPNQSADNWLCSLRNISRKCDFGQDCCALCEVTRIFDQLISVVANNTFRINIWNSATHSLVRPKHPNYKLRRCNKTIMQSKLFAAHLTNQANQLRATTNKPASPQTRNLATERQQHVDTVAASTTQHHPVPSVQEKMLQLRKRQSLRIVKAITSEESVAISVVVHPNGPTVTIQELPDTGSQLDAIPHSLYRISFPDIPLRPGVAACNATGNAITCVESFAATIDWLADDGLSRPVTTTLYVLEDLQQPVLCSEIQRKLGMLHSKYPHPHINQISSTQTYQPSEEQKKADLASLMAEIPRVFDGVCRVMTGPHLPFLFQRRSSSGENWLQTSIGTTSSPLSRRSGSSGQTSYNPKSTARGSHALDSRSSRRSKKAGLHSILPDYCPLNKFLIGSKFDNATPFQSVRSIPKGMKFFTVVDVISIRLWYQKDTTNARSTRNPWRSPHSQHRRAFTSIYTPNISHAGDYYVRRNSDIFGHIPNAAHCMKDLVIYSRTYEEHINLLRILLKTANDNNVSFNKNKTVFAKPTAIFPQYERLANITDLRSFYGLCQQGGNFSDKITAAFAPLSPLLKKKSAKSDLVFYDPSRPTSLAVDTSLLNELGFILKQQSESGTWHVVQAGSRFLRPPETRYAMIELEFLAASWGMKQSRQFLKGILNFDQVTDHRPFVSILNNYALDKLENPRLLQLRLQMARDNFIARWIPGNRNIKADTLSRSPISPGAPSDELGEGPQNFTARIAMVAVIAESSETNITLEKKQYWPIDLRPYWDARHQLAKDNTEDMIVFGLRIVLPKSMVKQTTQTRLGMDINIAASTWVECVSQLPSLPAEPLQPHEPATRPFEVLHADLGEFDGRHFLVIVNQFSGWSAVTMFPEKNTTAQRLINSFRMFFTDIGGAPVKVFSDNSPFKAAELQSSAPGPAANQIRVVFVGNAGRRDRCRGDRGS
uniref:Reverse transcriptase RNase H-like domain-containing protein n=1 Tax=Daphnia galeata TaxID=27404 RepID=A0A8J2RWS0_9CRUS|nr:unnamed protein product [Daphnia galeata]